MSRQQAKPEKPFPPLLALNFFYAFSFSAVFLGPVGNRYIEQTSVGAICVCFFSLLLEFLNQINTNYINDWNLQ